MASHRCVRIDGPEETERGEAEFEILQDGCATKCRSSAKANNYRSAQRVIETFTFTKHNPLPCDLCETERVTLIGSRRSTSAPKTPRAGAKL